LTSDEFEWTDCNQLFLLNATQRATTDGSDDIMDDEIDDIEGGCSATGEERCGSGSGK